MPSKFTLAIAACIAYGATSVIALPAQGAYDLSERDFADFTELDARMFDNSFEDFVARQVDAQLAVETPVAPGPPAIAEPIMPAIAHRLSATGSTESAPLPHQRHGGRRRRHYHHRHSPNHASAGSTGAKEAAVSTPGAHVPDASVPTHAQDAGESASRVAARSASDIINARDLPAHGTGTRRAPRTPSEILDDHTIDPEQRRRELLAAKRYREALAHREALRAAGQGRR